MDPLVLIRVRAALDGALRGSILREVRDEPPHRHLLVFEGECLRTTVVVSLRAELPWIGYRAAHRPRSKVPPSAVSVACGRAISGRVLERIDPVGTGRAVAFRFKGGGSLVAELGTHAANLLLLDAAEVVVSAARTPRSAQGRCAEGERYHPRPVPAGLLDVAAARQDQIERVLETAATEGEAPVEALRRRLFGVGSAGARLVLQESARSGRSPAAVLLSRLEQLRSGAVGPVVVGPVSDPVRCAEEEGFDPGTLELLPWPPDAEPGGAVQVDGGDPAATAGIYHEAIERGLEVRLRIDALRSILRKEIQRMTTAEAHAARDVTEIGDPDRFRRFGEALLAGLAQARRVGDHVLVPDPYDAEGRETSVPAPAGKTLPSVADAHFRRHRRARRGIAAGGARIETVRRRRLALEALAERFARASGASSVEALTDAMRAEGVPVGLEHKQRRTASHSAESSPRLEGVRLFRSTDGSEILVGRTGKDNARLTFHLAGPEDFWLHAAGHTGAHVVVRNPGQLARPSDGALVEAASLAAWYSAARGAAAVDVQWTRRKYVRRARGRGPGTVVVKRSEVIRVRPALPPGFVESA